MELIGITQAQYVSDYKIQLLFSNGFKGIVDLKNSLKGHLLAPLKNKEYFKTFQKNVWTIEWACKADFVPEYLFELAQKGK